MNNITEPQDYFFNIGDLVRTTYHHNYNGFYISPTDFGIVVRRYYEYGRYKYSIYFQNCGKTIPYAENHMVLVTS